VKLRYAAWGIQTGGTGLQISMEFIKPFGECLIAQTTAVVSVIFYISWIQQTGDTAERFDQSGQMLTLCRNATQEIMTHSRTSCSQSKPFSSFLVSRTNFQIQVWRALLNYSFGVSQQGLWQTQSVAQPARAVSNALGQKSGWVILFHAIE